MNNLIRNNRTLVFCLLIVGLNTACQKYEEGPAVSLRSKKERVANTWKAEKIIDNGKEETNSSIRITFSKGGNYTNSQGGLLSAGVNGTWTFSSDKEEIQTVVDVAGFKQVRNWQILKLEEKSLWLKDGNMEYHLIPD